MFLLFAFDAARWQVGGGLSWQQTCFAPFWSQLPNFGARPRMIDAFRVSHRHAIYKQLITSTGGEDVWGKNCQHHWLWAYSAQLDWQQRSGRLNIADANAGDAIAVTSWWGLMNYCFCVCVLLGAAEVGLVPTPILTQVRSCCKHSTSQLTAANV